MVEKFTARRIKNPDTWKAIEVANRVGPEKTEYGSDSCVRHKNQALDQYYGEGVSCERCRIEKLAEEGKACRKHWYEYRVAADTCWSCENEKEYSSPDWGTRQLAKFSHMNVQPFIEGRKRSSISTLSKETAIDAIRALADSPVGRPQLNTTYNQNGEPYRHRCCLWKLKDEDGVERGIMAAMVMDGLGIKDFKITSQRWFSIWIPKELTVRGILSKSSQGKK